MTTRVAAGPVRGSYFYVWSALTCALVAFLGFAPTYFVPLAQGTFAAYPIVHLHGLVFFFWTLFFAYQAWLVARGRTIRHREIGLLGISLATAMTFLGLLVAVAAAERVGRLGFMNEGKVFMIVPVTGICTFAMLFALAIANVKHKEVHKRLLLVATASILDAAVARWFLTFFAPPLAPGASPVPPVMVALLPALLVDLFIIAGMLYDRRTRGRPHPAYLPTCLPAYLPTCSPVRRCWPSNCCARRCRRRWRGMALPSGCCTSQVSRTFRVPWPGDRSPIPAA